MRNPENLEIYHEALQVSVDVEVLLESTEGIRASARRQIERAANSIADNIAEGC